METGNIKINDLEYTMTKMPLGRYVALIKAIKKLPQMKSIKGIKDLDQQQIISILPNILEDAAPELFAAISIISGIPADVLENEAGIDDLTDIIILAFALNNVDKIKKNLSAMQVQWAGEQRTEPVQAQTEAQAI